MLCDVRNKRRDDSTKTNCLLYFVAFLSKHVFFRTWCHDDPDVIKRLFIPDHRLVPVLASCQILLKGWKFSRYWYPRLAIQFGIFIKEPLPLLKRLKCPPDKPNRNVQRWSIGTIFYNDPSNVPAFQNCNLQQSSSRLRLIGLTCSVTWITKTHWPFWHVLYVCVLPVIIRI